LSEGTQGKKPLAELMKKFLTVSSKRLQMDEFWPTQSNLPVVYLNHLLPLQTFYN
jgi:hypothetical protein